MYIFFVNVVERCSHIHISRVGIAKLLLPTKIILLLCRVYTWHRWSQARTLHKRAIIDIDSTSIDIINDYNPSCLLIPFSLLQKKIVCT